VTSNSSNSEYSHSTPLTKHSSDKHSPDLPEEPVYYVCDGFEDRVPATFVRRGAGTGVPELALGVLREAASLAGKRASVCTQIVKSV
jgi:hypothetical protein